MSLKKKNKLVFFRSIKFRLTLWYAVCLLITVTIVSAYFYFYMNRNLSEISRKYLQDELNTVIQLTKNELHDRQSLINFLSEYVAAQKGIHKINYALFDENGFLIAGSADFMEDQGSIDTLKKLPATTTYQNVYETTKKNNEGKNIILISALFQQDLDGQRFFIQFGIDPLSNRKTLKTMINMFFMTIPVVLIFVLIGGFILTGKMLSQLSNLTRAVRNLSFTGNNQKLPLAGTGDELDQLAQEFNNVYDRLNKSYQRIVSFTADASHELRLPISAIKGEAEVVLENERSLDEYQRVLQGIIEEMDNLTRMLARLLMLARADSDADYLLKERIDLGNLVEQITEFYQPLAESKDISISFKSELGDIYIQADKLKLHQLFSNLIENAIKYNVRNGNITIQLSTSKEACCVAISDTGIGIPNDEQKKIFDRFYRVDKSRSRSEGSAGLGLSIAEMIVEEHCGNITVESSPGRGSIFTVILPRS